MFSRVQPLANSSSNPRKRQKRAHSDSDSEDASSRTHPHPRSAMPRAPTPTQPLVSTNTTDEKQPCHHEQALARLEPDLDSMRQLITCKICQRFLSEPYGLACGHTYCYVCLDAWLVAQRKRTCPDCRATIKQQPVPSFLIREMTRVFAYRAELLPDGETVEEHDEYIKEAVAKVSGDKEGPGLFRGLFNNADRLRWGPLHDPGDDVERCPVCHWELEEGRCGSCGLTVGDEDGFGLDTGESESSDDDELDNEMVPHDYDGMDDPGSFDEDDFMDEEGGHHYPHDDDEHDGLDLDAFGVLPRPAAALSRQRRHRHQPINLDSEPESEDSEDPDNDPQMDGFLDNEDIEELGSGSSQEQSDSEPEAEETPRTNRPRQFIRPMVIHDSDDDVQQQPRRPVIIESSDEDEDEEGPVARNNQRAGKVSRGTRRQHVFEISSSEDTSDDDAEDPDRHNGNTARDRQVAPGRRHRSIPVDSESGSNSDADSESDDAGGVDAGGFSPLQSEADNESQADQFEGNYGAYGAYDHHAHGDSDEGGDFDAFYQQGDSEIDDYNSAHAAHELDVLNAMNYADDDDDDENDNDDDGGRSTTAGSAPFPSPFCFPEK